MDYSEFLNQKSLLAKPCGITAAYEDLHPQLFNFQQLTTKRSLKLGKSAIFAQTGQGKTITQLSWAEQIVKHCGAVLLVAPLAVSKQTAFSESKKFGIETTFCENMADVTSGINVTNYEKLHKFDAKQFAGIICDEAHILSNPEGFTSQSLVDFASSIPYRLACTATPAANDFDEFGMIAEFLGVMSRPEMLATFFRHDGGETSKWMLVGHGERRFWEWVCSWCTAFKSPDDLGFDGTDYALPELIDHHHIVESPLQPQVGRLTYEIKNLNDRRRARRACTVERCEITAEQVNNSGRNALVFCDYNDEGDLLEKLIDGAVQVSGSDTPEWKAQCAIDFAEGRISRLIGKGTMIGAGMNFQYHCHDVYFVGIDDSWKKLHQCTSRIHRYGQTKPVNRHFAYSVHEQVVLDNLNRKRDQDSKMWAEFKQCMMEAIKREESPTSRNVVDYNPKIPMRLPSWINCA